MPRTSTLTLLVLTAACATDRDSDTSAAAADDPVARATGIARHFVDGYYHTFPEEAYEVGYPDTPMDSLGDRSLAALASWQAKEDAWLDTLRTIDAAALEGTPSAVPYAFTLDRLESSVARRICRMELWNVSPTWTGWQSMLASTFSQQPVGSAQERATALTRLRAVPSYIDTEIANLRAGLARGYTAPKSNVDAVLEQVNEMLASPTEASPFHDPASRAGDDTFAADVRALHEDRIEPAITRYRDFLRDEYRSGARDAVGVSANPDGQACYAASVRFHTSLPLTAQRVHDNGLREMERIQSEMRTIAERSFNTTDVPALLQRLRTDPQYTFRSEDDVLAYARRAVERAAVAVHEWFGFVPETDVVVKPFPAYQKASGSGFYSAGAEDGSRPGSYELGTYDPTHISRAGMEATAFHETYPGHHLQMSVALHGKGVHPVLRYVYVAGMAEGWGLYSERLADEMGLYTSDVDRLGMLSNEALRASRLVVDPGMHSLGWTRERAIEYMLDHTAESENSVTAEVDRYIAVPGQATAYLTGSLEIQRLRRMAADSLGDAFDVKGFHDRVLGDGAVSLPMLAESIRRWIAERRRAAGGLP